MGSMTYMHLRDGRLSQRRSSARTVEGAWQTVGAVCGVSGGMITALLGALLTAITWLTGASAGYGLWLHRAGAVLLFSTIPLLIFGAHCLDLMEKHADR